MSQLVPKIVVSYRRTDSAMAGRIFDRLVQRFGKKSLFIDIDNIPFGADFRKHIDGELKASDVLVALVGPQWLGGQGEAARIAREADPVRVEIETALRQNIPVLPVLLDGAMMPEPSELPESIRDFAYRNAAEVESGRDFEVHVERLIGAVEQILGGKAPPARTPPPSKAAALLSTPPNTGPGKLPLVLGLVALLAALGAGLWFGRDLLTPAGITVPAATADFCEDFKRVIDEARTDFVSILGSQSGQTWTSRIQLPGWEDCTIRDWTYEGLTSRYFSCTAPPIADNDELRARQEEAAAYIKPCLGQDFVERRTRYKDQTYDVFYERGPNDPFARLRGVRHEDPEEWLLRLDVETPKRPADAEAN